ncbi:hypothetical protein GGR56DRAFT_398861 [Xylariaceae sp. FL0804]|nr:hypothetical protein GGR56DRAFT_398861 [Xylariaceae sp. FL0804]
MSSSDQTANRLGDVNQIHEWRSIVTLIVFVLANIVVLFPFHIPFYVPRVWWNSWLKTLSVLRITPPPKQREEQRRASTSSDPLVQPVPREKPWKRLRFPVNFMTGPVIAVLFLLAILAIGRTEVRGGIAGTDNIEPYDIMLFFLSLAYIAISIDASGLIRYLAFRVLKWGGKVGRRLFLYLYLFFFALGSVIGNDPIILSGTAFLAYMTRVSSNIVHPRAWIHTQFSIANMASAILVSSNPTNLVLAGAFNIKFVDYTAHMIVPVVITVIVLFPFLLYVVFRDEALIPQSIMMHDLSEEAKARPPVNPNIPNARGTAEEAEKQEANNEEGQLLSLEEIMNPFLDHWGAGFGAFIMISTLIALLILNAVTDTKKKNPVYWVTLPAAFIMFCWDISFGWIKRQETREIAWEGRRQIKEAQRKREEEEEAARRLVDEQDGAQSAMLVLNNPTLTLTRSPESLPLEPQTTTAHKDDRHAGNAVMVSDRGDPLPPSGAISGRIDDSCKTPMTSTLVAPNSHDSRTPASTSSPESSIPAEDESVSNAGPKARSVDAPGEKVASSFGGISPPQAAKGDLPTSQDSKESQVAYQKGSDQEKQPPNEIDELRGNHGATLVSLSKDAYRWSQETFPTTTAVIAHLPFALVPFAFSMFILVQGLASKGWVEVFAYGWDHWVDKTGTIGSIGGMGFLSVVLCNAAGTNIGTTILLSRVLQQWNKIPRASGLPIDERTWWASIYTMALGVNYGAFSLAFSASLAGLLWRDILARKHIKVGGLEFARVNLPIITVAMIVGCAILTGEVYIVYDGKS